MQLLCRPFIFQGHVGGNKNLPEKSRLDQVNYSLVAKGIEEEWNENFRMSHVNSAMNFLYLSNLGG